MRSRQMYYSILSYNLLIFYYTLVYAIIMYDK